MYQFATVWKPSKNLRQNKGFSFSEALPPASCPPLPPLTKALWSCAEDLAHITSTQKNFGQGGEGGRRRAEHANRASLLMVNPKFANLALDTCVSILVFVLCAVRRSLLAKIIGTTRAPTAARIGDPPEASCFSTVFWGFGGQFRTNAAATEK